MVTSIPGMFVREWQVGEMRANLGLKSLKKQKHTLFPREKGSAIGQPATDTAISRQDRSISDFWVLWVDSSLSQKNASTLAFST